MALGYPVIASLILLGSLVTAPVSALCRALALSGGGAYGAYEMGVLSGFVENLPPAEVEWDVISGISVGSINTLGISTFPIGEEKRMVDTLTTLWANMTTDRVYKKWPILGPGQALILKSGMYDSSPLRESLIENFGDPVSLANRKIVVGATSLNTGTLHTWTEEDKDELIQAVMCSSAIPGIFPTQTVPSLHDTFSDGGDIVGINIFGAIERCRETESDDTNIVVDVITTWSDVFRSVDSKRYDALSVMQRKSALSTFLKTASAVEDAILAFPRVSWRYNVSPTSTLPGSMLSFVPSKLSQMIKSGRADALDAIAQHNLEKKKDQKKSPSLDP